ncbi:trigger factor [Blautia liquoris]|uniref:Trigger factor n=1 Tax=Blautia liquoris TaxID=2779518 RepID=A0A7M2RH91_9FIRM|nr:trigger factor [Blautia liquoris]QOV19703.1 trigger factor [Blautia liquoris]
MSVQVEKLEHNMAKLTIEVSAADFDKAIQKVYEKQKSKISIPGFRKGKTPRAVIEKMYGTGIFYEDAANDTIQQNYPAAVSESELSIVSQPDIQVVQIEKGKPFIFTAEVAVKPEVTLGEYKGLEVSKSDLTVTDEDVDEEIKKEQDKNARTITIEDRFSQEGDTVTIDFDGSIDGVAFDGGSAKDYPLTLGAHQFIPGFEEQLVGRNPEETVDVHVTFPEDYQAEELRGKEAVFQCVIHKIEAKELPELDDEFAQDVSEFDTMEEYKADIRKNLESKKEEEAKRAKEDAAVDKAIENATMDIPDAMVDTQVNQMVDDFAKRIQSQGLTMEQYMQFTGSTMDSVREQMKPQALKSIQSRLVLEKIAEAEKIEIGDDRLDEEIKNMAEMYKMEPDKFKDLIGDYEKEQMKQDLSVQEAITFLADSAVEK